MTKTSIKTIAVLCSGGDSPGMNCAIRAVVRTAIGEGLNVFGIQKGFQGLLENNIRVIFFSMVELFYKHHAPKNLELKKEDQKLQEF